ncbi:MAG: hypothetical protein HC853_01180 [Anaerolineae bacterium]|nr:hypothetical protein [Anaerolineae bacterium]
MNSFEYRYPTVGLSIVGGYLDGECDDPRTTNVPPCHEASFVTGGAQSLGMPLIPKNWLDFGLAWPMVQNEDLDNANVRCYLALRRDRAARQSIPDALVRALAVPTNDPVPNHLLLPLGFLAATFSYYTRNRDGQCHHLCEIWHTAEQWLEPLVQLSHAWWLNGPSQTAAISRLLGQTAYDPSNDHFNCFITLLNHDNARSPASRFRESEHFGTAFVEYLFAAAQAVWCHTAPCANTALTEALLLPGALLTGKAFAQTLTEADDVMRLWQIPHPDSRPAKRPTQAQTGAKRRAKRNP